MRKFSRLENFVFDLWGYSSIGWYYAVYLIKEGFIGIKDGLMYLLGGIIYLSFFPILVLAAPLALIFSIISWGRLRIPCEVGDLWQDDHKEIITQRESERKAFEEQKAGSPHEEK